MSTSTDNLFKYDPLPKYLEEQRRFVAIEAGRLKTVHELDEKSQAIIERAWANPVVLHPDRAELESSVSEGGVMVRVAVPIEGDTRLLQHPPTPRHVGPYATISDGGWMDSTKEPTLAFDLTFDKPTTPAEVKDAARGFLNRIQVVLDAQQPLIDEYNAQIKAHASAVLNARRQVLASSEGLQEGLGGGL